MVTRIGNAQGRVLTNLLNDGRMNRLLEHEALRPGASYPLVSMLEDLRQAIWTEIYTSRPVADVYRRELQNRYLTAFDGKLNPPATSATQATQTAAPLSEDARSHLRGELVTLRRELQTALQRTTDRATQVHIQSAIDRIDRILDPR